MPPVRIVADDCERAGGVIAELGRLAEVDLIVRRLAVGNFVIAERVVVERKTMADLARSVVDGRLFRQAARLGRTAGRAVLVLEGTEAETATLGVSRESLQGARINVGVFFGLTVLQVGDPAETARLLVYLGRQAGRFARGALPRAGYRPRGLRGRQLFVLQGLPGIGPERASRLLDRFGSIAAVATASVEALEAVNGVGRSTAAAVRRVFGPPGISPRARTARAGSAGRPR